MNASSLSLFRDLPGLAAAKPTRGGGKKLAAKRVAVAGQAGAAPGAGRLTLADLAAETAARAPAARFVPPADETEEAGPAAPARSAPGGPPEKSLFLCTAEGCYETRGRGAHCPRCERAETARAAQRAAQEDPPEVRARIEATLSAAGLRRRQNGSGWEDDVSRYGAREVKPTAWERRIAEGRGLLTWEEGYPHLIRVDDLKHSHPTIYERHKRGPADNHVPLPAGLAREVDAAFRVLVAENLARYAWGKELTVLIDGVDIATLGEAARRAILAGAAERLGAHPERGEALPDGLTEPKPSEAPEATATTILDEEAPESDVDDGDEDWRRSFDDSNAPPDTEAVRCFRRASAARLRLARARHTLARALRVLQSPTRPAPQPPRIDGDGNLVDQETGEVLAGPGAQDLTVSEAPSARQESWPVSLTAGYCAAEAARVRRLLASEEGARIRRRTEEAAGAARQRDKRPPKGAGRSGQRSTGARAPSEGDRR